MRKVALTIAGVAIGSVLAFAIVWLSGLLILGALWLLEKVGFV